MLGKRFLLYTSLPRFMIPGADLVRSNDCSFAFYVAHTLRQTQRGRYIYLHVPWLAAELEFRFVYICFACHLTDALVSVAIAHACQEARATLPLRMKLGYRKRKGKHETQFLGYGVLECESVTHAKATVDALWKQSITCSLASIKQYDSVGYKITYERDDAIFM